MNKNNLTFDTETLVINWVGLNIESLTDIEPMANGNPNP